MLVLKTDYRYGGKPHYYIAEENDVLMQVPDFIRKCVMFVGCKKGNESDDITWYGTAFAVGVPMTDKSATFCYIVSAKHVIEKIKYYSKDGNVIIRLNKTGGIFEDVPVSVDNWKNHPTDKTIDVSAIMLALPQNLFDYLYIPIDTVADEKAIETDGIGVGDEIFLTGLFSYHHGVKKNLPVVRVGNIAMMPEEKVYATIYEKDTGEEIVPMEAYLVEVRSIGGLSGSPVFVSTNYMRKVGETIHMTAPSGKAFHWLGLMQGHWELSKNEIDAIITEDAKKKDSINMGIAIVVPTPKIQEVLDQPFFMDIRKKTEEEKNKKNAPVADSVENEPTKEEFMENLKKVSQKITPSGKKTEEH